MPSSVPGRRPVNEQGSQAWRAERVGRITGSRIGAILGVSPFQSRAAVLRQMVNEARGEFTNIDAPPLRWGNEHEAEAARVYTALYASGQEVTECGFYPVGVMLGASPDRLVGSEGLVEIKCPYGIRDELSPKFKTISECPHYWHQIQLQLYATGRQWCDFFQWTPHDYCCERVHADPEWFDSIEDDLDLFYEEYIDRVRRHDFVSDTPAFEMAAQAYISAKAEADKAKAQLDAARDHLIGLVEATDEQEVDCPLLKLTQYETKGRVNYSAMTEELGIDPEPYRAEGSKSWRITVNKEAASAES